MSAELVARLRGTRHTIQEAFTDMREAADRIVELEEALLRARGWVDVARASKLRDFDLAFIDRVIAPKASGTMGHTTNEPGSATTTSREPGSKEPPVIVEAPS